MSKWNKMGMSLMCQHKTIKYYSPLIYSMGVQVFQGVLSDATVSVICARKRSTCAHESVKLTLASASR